jgi:hypothetical protein
MLFVIPPEHIKFCPAFCKHTFSQVGVTLQNHLRFFTLKFSLMTFADIRQTLMRMSGGVTYQSYKLNRTSN